MKYPFSASLENFPGYTIYYNGDVKNKSGKWLKGHTDKSGYRIVKLINKKSKLVGIARHRLVALAFIPNIGNKLHINHKDGLKFNNHITNLEWVTIKENAQHYKEVLMPKVKEETKRNAMGLKEFPKYKIAKELGISTKTLYNHIHS